jgi:coenzyme F420-reducing hydrogenase alpha subunit
MPSASNRTLRVPVLARVEGEGGMVIRTHNGRVSDVELRIFEPPRFFEAFLRGRSYTEPPDITARICGICPVAYQMSACLAIENACGITVAGPLHDLRRLLYCGEWIESHALHIYLLHAPDYLGYQGAVDMARDHRAEVERGLQLKKVGNEILAAVGGRAVHPVNVRVGGFYRVPTRAELEPLAERLRWARDAAAETARWVAGFDFPDFEPAYEFVALRSDTTYPILEGRLGSSLGLDIAVDEFEEHFVEEHVARSNALHAHIRGRGSYLTGPLARFNLNSTQLSPTAQEVMRDVKLEPPIANPFRSIVVRAVELVYACDEALRLIAEYRMPDRPAIPVQARAGTGCGCTEAPRGILYHRYRIDDDGLVAEARIVPPTSQNQAQIEADLRAFVEPRLDLPTALLTRQCEQAIRNYDPCISCATHFVSLEVRETD